MFEQHIQDFVEARIEQIRISKNPAYNEIEIEKEQAKAALQPLFTDAKIGNRLLNEYDETAYRQAIVEVEAAYRQGFADGMKLLSQMAAPIGRDA